jgi:3-oxoacyl-[acyl-carrier protein] reductase
VAVQAHSADTGVIQRAVGETVQQLGGLDIFVNSAAVGPAGPILDPDLAQFQRT